jgi:hypothetical protein
MRESREDTRFIGTGAPFLKRDYALVKRLSGVQFFFIFLPLSELQQCVRQIHELGC